MKIGFPNREGLRRPLRKRNREIPRDTSSARDILEMVRERTPIPDRRSGSDRRKTNRGGRRTTDKTPDKV